MNIRILGMPALVIVLVALNLMACSPEDSPTSVAPSAGNSADPRIKAAGPKAATQPRPDVYATVPLVVDLSGLTDRQRQMIALLIDASRIMDDLFWRQAYGDREALLNSLKDPVTRRFADINYGPWDRLDGDKSFLDGVGPKPLGAQFYPADMTREEFAAADLPGKIGLYSLIQRDATGALQVVPYHKAYAVQLQEAAGLLQSASALAEDKEFARYLQLRAQALVTDDYQPSDLAWMDMKNNPVDVVIGAIETYEDALFGYRAAYESYVLLKDLAWSEKLARYASFLPELQAGLPVPDTYKAETPGRDSDLNAYDVLYYAGHSNAGSKTIAINLPNDEEVQLAKGTRRLQLKNAMRAKFDRILVPIADVLIDPAQRQHITFDAFFGNTMFHEVAHGLGIKNTIDGSGRVREALQELASATEEGKADILGLYMVSELFARNEIPDGELMDNFVTFMAGIFRSVRFGASSAHGRANMVRFNFFAEQGAFSRDPETGFYSVNRERMPDAIRALSNKLLTLQGDGDYAGTSDLMDEMGVVSADLQADLDRLGAAGIPVDIVFEQGPQVLGLTSQ